MSSLVIRLLEKRPEDRYGSAAELAEDLQRVRVGLPPLAMVPVKGDPEATQNIDALATAPLPSDILVHKAMRRKRVRARASSILVAAFALFALLGGVSWNLLQDSWGRDSISNLKGSQEQGSIPNLQDSQEQDPASSSQETTSEATEQPKQAASSEAPSTKSPAKSGAPANIAQTDASAGQTSPVEAAAIPSAPASTGIGSVPQQASAQPAPQQASAQPTSQQQQAPQQEAAQPAPKQASAEPALQQESAGQAQVKVVSSYTSSGGANRDRNSDGIQTKQHGGKASQNSKSSRKD